VEKVKKKKNTFTDHNVTGSYVVYGLFNDAVSSTDYKLPDDRMINESWIGKDMEGRGRDLSRHLLGGGEENHEKPQSG
jgi:hypothetical protein